MKPPSHGSSIPRNSQYIRKSANLGSRIPWRCWKEEANSAPLTLLEFNLRRTITVRGAVRVVTIGRRKPVATNQILKEKLFNLETSISNPDMQPTSHVELRWLPKKPRPPKSYQKVSLSRVVTVIIRKSSQKIQLAKPHGNVSLVQRIVTSILNANLILSLLLNPVSFGGEKPKAFYEHEPIADWFFPDSVGWKRMSYFRKRRKIFFARFPGRF